MLPCHIGGEWSHILEQVGTVAALDVLHDHAEMLPRLEAAVHGYHERVVREGHDVTLRKHLLNLKRTNSFSHKLSIY